MPEIRAFLAIDLDEDLKPKINKIIKSFKEIDANIKYVDLANLHFTLKFFGDIDVEGIDLLSQKISNVVSEFEPFNIKIKGCGAFPNNNHIKVIWVGLEGDEILKSLHDKLDVEFKKLGFEAETGNFLYQSILQSPANYLQYYVGYLNFKRLQESEQAKLQERFSLEEFHRTVLESGPMPFALLEAQFQ